MSRCSTPIKDSNKGSGGLNLAAAPRELVFEGGICKFGSDKIYIAVVMFASYLLGAFDQSIHCTLCLTNPTCFPAHYKLKVPVV